MQQKHDLSVARPFVDVVHAQRATLAVRHLHVMRRKRIARQILESLVRRS